MTSRDLGCWPPRMLNGCAMIGLSALNRSVCITFKRRPPQSIRSSVCHAQQTHVRIASARCARIHLDLAENEEVIGLRAIGAREQSAVPGGTFHLDISATGGEPTKLGRLGIVVCIYTTEVGGFLHFSFSSAPITLNNNVSLKWIREARPQWRRWRQEGRRPPEGYRRLPCERQRDHHRLWCEAGQHRRLAEGRH